MELPKIIEKQPLIKETEFTNKVIIVTGGADGIGYGCVLAFLKEGAYVCVIDFDEKKLIDIKHDKIACFYCDVSNTDRLKKVVGIIIEKFGRIDVVVNNAGVHPPVVSIEDYSVSDFNKLLQINLVSNYALCQYTFNELKKTKGSIINISSMVALLGQENATAYCSSKAGQIGLTKALALEGAKYGIRVNAICPSNVLTTSMIKWAATFKDSKAALKSAEDVQALKRMALPEEIANLVVFYASSKSSFLTGTCMEADGGASLDY